MSDPPRIPSGHLLVVAPARLDDACFSIPATRALAALDQVDAVTVLCGSDQQALWQSIPGIEILALPPGTRTRETAGRLSNRELPFSAALVWEDGEATAAINKSAIGTKFGSPDLGRGFQDIAVTRRAGPVEHRVRDYLLVAEKLGAQPFAAGHFSPVKLATDPPPHSIALVPDSDFGSSHQWPTERWLELGRELTDRRQLKPTIVGPGPRANALAKSLGEGAQISHPVSLAERLEIFARHRFVVATDGTAPHLAAHVGATCLVLFGPNDPRWRRSLGKRHAHVRRHVECAPCRLADCPLDHRCMNELTTESVLASLAAFLDPAS